jgi:hypothetical protein
MGSSFHTVGYGDEQKSGSLALDATNQSCGLITFEASCGIT